MKRIVSIQDLSCIGKCSLGVALPVLSAMGIECAVLPTALLSAHTEFEGFVSRDLGDSFSPITAHWKALGLRFDAIYSGYLGSEAQIDRLEGFLDVFATAQTRLFIDPVMADGGRLYAGISAAFPARMRELLRRADFITPNVTEACLLTNTPYRQTQDEAFVRSLLEKLLQFGVQTAIVTGIRTDAGHMGIAAMERDGVLRLHNSDYLPSTFYGAGDLFASACVGALTRGLSCADAVALAADYVAETLRVTADAPDARWYGVNFEATLPYLMRRIDALPRKEESE